VRTGGRRERDGEMAQTLCGAGSGTERGRGHRGAPGAGRRGGADTVGRRERDGEMARTLCGAGSGTWR
jgi:hypothetical protein